MFPTLASWIPLVTGAATVLMAVASILKQLATGVWDGTELATDWQSIMAALAGFGLMFAKAKNVTGGTVAATPEAVTRVAKS
jgi:hypothetical protein